MKGESRPFECPKCGFNYFKKHNYMSKINELLKTRNKSSRAHLKTVANAIKSHVPSDAQRDKYYFFLYNTKDVDDNVLIWGLDTYFKGNHHLKGKGFAYLKSIILSRDKNNERISKNERKMIGCSPPIMNEENNNEKGKNKN
jgi:hypothetical protein|tara:strand:+ start:183 stop:608 length:426 start_codon:yes stop_codon:yes gene_type:complete